MRGLPAAHQTAHLASQSGRRTSSASGVVLMLSPARKTRVCLMGVAGKTVRPSTGRRYHSAASSPAPGVLHESLGWLPNLFGAKRRNHSSTVPKTGLRLVCSMKAKTCLYGHIQRPARTTKIYPTRVTGKTGLPSIRRRYRSASSSPAQCYLFACNHPMVDALEDRIKSPIPWHAP